MIDVILSWEQIYDILTGSFSYLIALITDDFLPFKIWTSRGVEQVKSELTVRMSAHRSTSSHESIVAGLAGVCSLKDPFSQPPSYSPLLKFDVQTRSSKHFYVI